MANYYIRAIIRLRMDSPSTFLPSVLIAAIALGEKRISSSKDVMETIKVIQALIVFLKEKSDSSKDLLESAISTEADLQKVKTALLVDKEAKCAVGVANAKRLLLRELPDSLVVKATNALEVEERGLAEAALVIGVKAESALILARCVVGKFTRKLELTKLVCDEEDGV